VVPEPCSCDPCARVPCRRTYVDDNEVRSSTSGLQHAIRIVASKDVGSAAHHDLDDALEGFRKKDQKAWTPDEASKDHKALSMIHMHLSNNVL
jgi:hypothetical protein